MRGLEKRTLGRLPLVFSEGSAVLKFIPYNHQLGHRGISLLSSLKLLTRSLTNLAAGRKFESMKLKREATVG